jgi:hypothetical protein
MSEGPIDVSDGKKNIEKRVIWRPIGRVSHLGERDRQVLK